MARTAEPEGWISQSGEIAPGQWISSGAVTGVHRIVVGDKVEAVFDGRISVECAIKAA